MTFQELMDCWDRGEYNCNRAVYDKILEHAERSNLVPVIGAGLSAWVEYPMWDELLRRHGAEFDVAEAVEAHLASWDYDEAAEVMAEACGDTWFDILRDSFDPRQIPERRGSRPAYQKWLPKLFRGLVLTTNFDRCLEDLYGITRSVNPRDDFQRAWADRAGFAHEYLLIKLHGDIENYEKLVLTRTAYDDCYGADPAAPDLTKPMPKFLSEQVNRRPMLFLGCSLHQDRTCAVLRTCSKVGSHYALLPRPKEEAEFARRREELRELGIRPIWYPAGQHDEALTAFFTRLAADCGLREEVQTDTPVYPLVGRDEVVEELCAHYSGPSPEPRWVTGVAGIGKTEVCREVIRQLSGKNPRFRMPMVDCTSAETYLQFYAAVAKGLGLEIPAHEAADPGAFLLRAIPGDCTGVYFDNFEDIWRGVGTERRELARWLLKLRDRGFALMFSSQDDLTPQLGRRVDLAALDGGAENAEKLDEAEFWSMDSVKLFTYIYGDVDRRELPHLRRLIRQMEGHPLAIVLTATQARERLMGLRTLLDRWDAVQEVYRGNERHTSLKNALALVWEEIKDDPAATFYWALHTTCVQPIPVEFHRWLVDDPELEAGMDRLRTGSLVRRDAAGISMLLPIKMQLPLLMADWEQTRIRALVRWAESLTRLLRLADDLGNPARPEAHSLAIDLMPQVCLVLRELAELEGQGADCLCRLLNEARNHYQYELSALSVLLHLSEHEILADRPLFRGIAYRYAGDLQCRLGELDKALEAYARAEELYRKERADLGLANTLRSRGDLQSRLGQVEQALEAYAQAEKLFRKERNDLGLANTLLSRGALQSLLGQVEQALEAYALAEELFRKERNDLGLANTLLSRGALQSRLGQVEQALEAYARAEELYRKERDDLGLANTLRSRGDLQRSLGQVEQALEAYARAEELFRKERDDLGLANTLLSRGALQSRLGEPDKALEQFRSACSLYRKEQEPVGLCCTLAEQYRIYAQAGQRTEAEPIRRELEKLLPCVPADVQEYVNGILDTAQPGMGC